MYKIQIVQRVGVEWCSTETWKASGNSVVFLFLLDCSNSDVISSNDIPYNRSSVCIERAEGFNISTPKANSKLEGYLGAVSSWFSGKDLYFRRHFD